ncbi:MAG: hypothetical protein ABEH47_05720 [Haloferacaceae archaeon]
MDFFKRAGRKVEEFKQTAKGAAEEHASYRCRSCDSRFHERHEQCPECGSKKIAEIDIEG